MAKERLQKVLARAGIASRRAAEEMIRQGRVDVNGRMVTELGTKVDPERDEIRVDGERVRLDKVRKRYIALHKPRHYITTMRDQFGRKTVVDLVPFAAEEHLVPVGRLDAESEGLLLLTNDGDVVNVLTHPRYQHEKEYVVEVYGHPDKDFFEAVKHGVVLDDGTRTLPAKVRVERKTDDTTILRVVLREGRKRQIRRMFGILGHPVRKLKRVRIGPITLGTLPRGAWRELTPKEVKALQQIVREQTRKSRAPRRSRKRRRR
nr:pseudouridine synthase [Ardenticatena sp.]